MNDRKQGVAPVFVHHLQQALATAATGSRPVPVSEGSSECMPLPVLVNLYFDDGTGIVLLPTSWVLRPHVRTSYDPPEPEQFGRLVIDVRIPRHRLVEVDESGNLVTPVAPVVPDAVIEPDTAVPGVPHEIAHLDPACWTANPEMYVESMKRLNAKPVVGTDSPM